MFSSIIFFFKTITMTKHGTFIHAIENKNSKQIKKMLNNKNFDHESYSFYWDLNS
jgi:hypothetical protein